MSEQRLPKLILPYLAAAIGAFLVGYLIVYLFIFPKSDAPEEAAVPSVTGLYQDDAIRRLNVAGFEGAEGESRQHPSAPAGTILEQDPAGGTVLPRGSRVTLVISQGQVEAHVPAILGLTRRQAESALREAGFEVGEVRLRPSNQARGEVIAVEPVVGTTLPTPSPVTITVSDGPESLAMPDVVGQSYPQVRLLMEQLGLALGPPMYDSTSFQEEYTILGQTPLPGVEVTAGTQVTLRVAGRAP